MPRPVPLRSIPPEKKNLILRSISAEMRQISGFPLRADCATRARTHNSPQSLRVLHSVSPSGCAFGHPLVSQPSLRGGNSLFNTSEPTSLKPEGALTMQSHTTTSTRHSRSGPPLLVEAVNKPGLIMEALLSAFHQLHRSAIKYLRLCNASCADLNLDQSIHFPDGKH